MHTNLRSSWPSRVARAILTPLAFSFNSGHFRSALLRRAVDRHNNPIPMYTYPAIDLLLSQKARLSDCVVLEWGAGQSTLWWEKHAKKVVTVERNEQWATYVKRQLTRPDRVELIVCHTDKEFLEAPSSQEFDIIIVDANPRIDAAKVALNLLKDEGVVIVDNSDLVRLRPILPMFHKAGFSRVDFYGYNPGSLHKQCTSFFSRSTAFWDRADDVAECSPLSRSD